MADLHTEVLEVKRLKDDEDLSFTEIGKRLGFSRKTAARRYAAALVDAVEQDEEQDFPEVPELEIEVHSDYLVNDKTPIERFTPLTREGDVMLTCDWHIPLHKPELINTMIQCAKREGINKLIIAGDYFNMETFSSFLPYQPEASLELERHDGNVVMKTLLRTFDEIDFIWGNHDFRLSRKLGFKKSFEECMQWMLGGLSEKEMEKLRFSELDYMHYYPEGEGSGRQFRICHPRDYSKSPLTGAKALSEKHGCSIFTAHSHHFAIGVAADGYNLLIEGGGFFDKTRTEYIQKSTKHPEWVTGFTFFKDGVPTLVGPTFGNDATYRKEG